MRIINILQKNLLMLTWKLLLPVLQCSHCQTRTEDGEWCFTLRIRDLINTIPLCVKQTIFPSFRLRTRDRDQGHGIHRSSTVFPTKHPPAFREEAHIPGQGRAGDWSMASPLFRLNAPQMHVKGNLIKHHRHRNTQRMHELHILLLTHMQGVLHF